MICFPRELEIKLIVEQFITEIFIDRKNVQTVPLVNS